MRQAEIEEQRVKAIDRHHQHKSHQDQRDGQRRQATGPPATQCQQIDQGRQKAAVDAGIACTEGHCNAADGDTVLLSADAVDHQRQLIRERARQKQHADEECQRQSKKGVQPGTLLALRAPHRDLVPRLGQDLLYQLIFCHNVHPVQFAG
ncbi:MAG: hypothetical protein KatS3mg057_0293 [Herpetosiphonaceae bacterium]|nr:MAG: hypothetical protein KatS3mg057_0293 [Herpetosiphonaceae bacterium]